MLGKPKRKFLDGNYDTYYNYRNPGAADDPRLEVLLFFFMTLEPKVERYTSL